MAGGNALVGINAGRGNECELLEHHLCGLMAGRIAGLVLANQYAASICTLG
jgi:hypothetical protein